MRYALQIELLTYLLAYLLTSAGVSVDAVCLNGGTCRDVEQSHRCDCHPGYEGSYCGDEVNECRSHPCLNGARCVDLVGRYHCDCPLGFQVTVEK